MGGWIRDTKREEGLTVVAVIRRSRPFGGPIRPHGEGLRCHDGHQQIVADVKETISRRTSGSRRYRG